ncbi:hypothetical protein B6N60_01824 [Richelia sinica FACHB-800]|uniref:DUF29 domain-containing protein n=1 Tax=Richelia sinica FACHB-800 TaxID=1357546 RepID=A0A975T743_9NOST|nr:DUF29 domain-containing protein [Richelia sinica]MBD2666140.1 DUF29 domain-containing protein [Richelia sinica FACHB-800]QXE23135.1 hypothetical protein B6N60_01824 [Richelia sinica FACHB-800]
MSESSLYETDFLAWINQQQLALSSRDITALDWENLAEELDAMGIREKNELKNRLVVLIAHLLKWQHQPAKRSISWFTTIANQRDDLKDLLAEKPSLNQYIPDILSKAYRNARREASAETGLALAIFPETCTYNIEEILNHEFLCNTTNDFERSLEGK